MEKKKKLPNQLVLSFAVQSFFLDLQARTTANLFLGSRFASFCFFPCFPPSSSNQFNASKILITPPPENNSEITTKCKVFPSFDSNNDLFPSQILSTPALGFVCRRHLQIWMQYFNWHGRKEMFTFFFFFFFLDFASFLFFSFLFFSFHFISLLCESCWSSNPFFCFNRFVCLFVCLDDQSHSANDHHEMNRF